jgi:hypothetical protein
MSVGRDFGQRRAAELLVDGAQALGALSIAGLLATKAVDVDGDLTMLAGRCVALDPSTSTARPPMHFRGDEDNGLAYVAANQWRTVAGGANAYTMSLGAGSQNGTLSWGGHLVPGLVTAQDVSADLNPLTPGAMYCRLNVTASVNLRGITGVGAATRLYLFANIGTNPLTVKHQDATATAATRIRTSTGADLTLAPSRLLLGAYEPGAQRWDVALLG